MVPILCLVGAIIHWHLSRSNKYKQILQEATCEDRSNVHCSFVRHEEVAIKLNAFLEFWSCIREPTHEVKLYSRPYKRWCSKAFKTKVMRIGIHQWFVFVCINSFPFSQFIFRGMVLMWSAHNWKAYKQRLLPQLFETGAIWWWFCLDIMVGHRLVCFVLLFVR